MPRYAIGDLFWDLEVPEKLLAHYLESGALMVEDPANVLYRIEISGITTVPKDPTEQISCVKGVRANAQKAGAVCVALDPDKVYYRTRQSGHFEGVPWHYEHWFAGFRNREAIITVSCAAEDEHLVDQALVSRTVESAIASLRLTHEPIVARKDEILVRDLAGSQEPWFEDQRHLSGTRVREALGIDEAEGHTLADLDTFWSRIVAEPPPDNEELNAVLNGLGVQFGDFLCFDGKFEWVVITDAYGTYLGVVALRGKANVTVDPFNFVTKRWSRREPRFLVHALQEIRATVDRFAADWRR